MAFAIDPQVIQDQRKSERRQQITHLFGGRLHAASAADDDERAVSTEPRPHVLKTAPATCGHTDYGLS